jgi:hypothetical protein
MTRPTPDTHQAWMRGVNKTLLVLKRQPNLSPRVGTLESRVDALESPPVARLLKTAGQSTSASSGVGTPVVWNSDTMASGMWASTANTKIFPSLAGVWRVRGKLRFAATSSVAGYVQVRLNGATNSPSEGLQTDGIGGAYPAAEDYFVVTHPGTDYFETWCFSTGANHSLTVANCLFTAEYIGAA